MAISAVTFDVGGTLIHANPSIPELFLSKAKACGVSLDLGTVQDYWKQCHKWYMDCYGDDSVFWGSDEEITRVWYAEYRRLCELSGLIAYADELVPAMHSAYLNADHWNIFDDVLPLFEYLQQRGIRMAAVSNWGRDLPGILEGLHLAQYFDVTAVSAYLGVGKPDARIFEWTLDCLGVQPDGVLHIGDALKADVLGAQSAGIHALFLDRKGFVHEKIVQVVESLDEVPGIIARLGE